MERTQAKRARLARILTGIFLFFILLCVFFLICESNARKTARTLPSYEKIDISPILQKEIWSAEDEQTLYLQTGVGVSALREMKNQPSKILAFQEALFYEGEVIQEAVAFTTSHDALRGYIAPIVDLQDGDILVTSTCHTLGWKNGHSAIVVNGRNQRILESYSLGYPSSVGDTTWFRNSANFMVLRLKDVARGDRAGIATWASTYLYDIPYSLTVGIFSPKNKEFPTKTHCSHLVWQAYMRFGYDIDADGGPVCTTKDIASSPLLEIVQVYGFDPVTLW